MLAAEASPEGEDSWGSYDAYAPLMGPGMGRGETRRGEKGEGNGAEKLKDCVIGSMGNRQ